MTDHVVVEADGGSRGNPGPAGYGAVVKDAESAVVLAERRAGLGVATNNVAEYSGLLAGLRAAAELGASIVDVRMDSKLVVEQMNGRWQVKNAALRPLADQARELVAPFDRVSFEWIPRARNTHADRLANLAMDEQTDAPAAESAQRAPESPPAAPRWTGITGAPTRMLLLRHGATELSVERRYSGRADVPLTERGRDQAAAAAKRVANLVAGAAASSIVSSPLSRAAETAAAVAEQIGGTVRTHPGLIEADFGDWEGLTFAEAAERDPELHRDWLTDGSVAAPRGESFADVFRRVRQVRAELLANYPARTVVVVSHVTPIKSLLRLGLAAGPALLYRLHLDLASLSIVDFYPDDNASVRLINDTSYLD